MIPLEDLILPGTKLRLLQFPDLVLDQFPGRPVRPGQPLPEPRQPLFRLLPIPPGCAYRLPLPLQTAKTVQRHPLGRRRKQRLVVMGAMQIDQPVPQFLEQPEGHRRSIEKLPPGAGGADLPLDHQGPIGI
ncbi:MAG: hypothetical protein EBZ83_02675, partial [Verrucomicrobia bacterium]|nr:hypothetical protein [Verrucomicrobiota bacterium]